MRGELETGTDCYILTQVLLIIAAGVAQPWATEGPKPSVCCWFTLRHLVPNWLQLARTASFTWLYNCLTTTCFRCSFAYLHRCISWLTARLRVNMLHKDVSRFLYVWHSSDNSNNKCRRGSLHGIIDNFLGCDYVLSKFKLQACCVHFWIKGNGMSTIVGVFKAEINYGNQFIYCTELYICNYSKQVNTWYELVIVLS